MTTPPTAIRPTGPARGQGNRPAAALVAVGSCCVVAGGVVAALTEPLRLAKGSWLAAYLVLVCGAAQYALGRPWVRPSRQADPPGLHWAQVGSWNLGNAAVIAGTLAAVPVLVDLGALLLVIALGSTLRLLRNLHPNVAEAHWRSRSVGWAYASLLLMLLVSIPVGVVLAHTRSGR